jgi:predicted metal-dependent hydrolase
MIRINKIIRSRRKTYSLEVTRKGELLVRAPLFMTDRQIEKIVLEKSDWIVQKMELVRRRQSEAPLHTFLDGDIFPFLGENYPLVIKSCQKSALFLADHTFVLDSRYLQSAKNLFESWYRNHARIHFSARISELAPRLNVQPKVLRISGARTRWGSCSTRGTVSLSWRLIMAPHTIIDYVIIHEMIHLRHPNHSAQFWAEVEKHYPDHKAAKLWLKNNGAALSLVD